MDQTIQFEKPFHARHAMQGELDPAAPVAAEGKAVIDAALERVWRVVTDIANWPEIRADIYDPKLEGALVSGAGFSWHTNGIALQSRFARVEFPALLTYSTWAPGLEMVHVYTFEALLPNRTRLSLAESMKAPVAAPHIGNAELGQGISSWLAGIKNLAEAN